MLADIRKAFLMIRLNSEMDKRLGWFLCLMAYQLFLSYLMPKPFSLKNSSGTI